MLDMHIRPSEIMGINDTYTAFCFDEACAFIISEIQDGKKPVIKKETNENKKVTRPSEIYAKYNN